MRPSWKTALSVRILDAISHSLIRSEESQVATYQIGYIALIVVQQLVIVGLLFGVAQLLHERHCLRGRLVRIRVAMGGADLSPARQEMASPQLQDLLLDPHMNQAAETGARVLASVDG
jgi:hypothetical protein